MFRARLGVRARILAIALIPSLTLLVVGVTAAGFLVRQGNYAKNWAIEMQRVIGPTAEMMEAIQLERQLTLQRTAGDKTLGPAITAARTRLDTAMKNVVEVSKGLIKIDPERLEGKFEDSDKLATGVAQARGAIDVGMLPALETYGFYNKLIDVISIGSQIAQQTAPNAETATELTESIRLLFAGEAMSRSYAVGLANLTRDGEAVIPIAEFNRQVGFYRTEVGFLTADLETEQAQAAGNLVSSTAWQQLSTMEVAISEHFVHEDVHAGAPTAKPDDDHAELPLTTEQWQGAATQVNNALIQMWVDQTRHAHSRAQELGERNEANSLYGGAGVILTSVIAFLIALWLANRIIRRLKLLRGETLALANDRLPELMSRLRAGEKVDPADESANLDFGHDEIGQVAKAFEQAHAAAVTGAIAEARTREGVQAVFLNIAHRSQIVVHRQLEILDEAENRQEDPALLETLFRLDHLATRERRNAENLIILGGGQPGRQWRSPVPLIDLVRSAVGETVDYARVRVSRLPEAHIMGSVVADLIHLLAELVDNATSFSPPQSKVEVFGNVVGKGLVVEITDQGMGMPEGELARVNEMLRNPPDFGVAALSVDSRLGLFVVSQLAARHGVSVRLSDSDYGGIRAIVLIPSAILAADSHIPLAESSLPEPGRRYRQSVQFTGEPLPERPPVRALESESTAVLTAPPAATPAYNPPAVEPPRLTSSRSLPPHSDAAFGSGPRTDTALGLPPRSEGGVGPDGRPLLPRRSRQANLAPQLAQQPPPATAPTPLVERARSAEQARDLMSAIENGTRQGRRAHPADQQTVSNSKDEEGYGDRSPNR
ncbi:nitrate- and nitrite sensing domain-containing protein [Nocardia sp. XZ_19_385]|uniref:sensor histidine kinase n=1 Tax=Nocardia sp. XZ_19_385 TaxID=2769488 RepID=UPI00188F63EC|nr:nitrate- and nitrite sensing domain-containing protein [Nocardia sp. XZ_19_385]